MENFPFPHVGRWYVPVSNWASNETITYAWGMATLMSRDLVWHLAAGAPHVSMPPGNVLWIEDVAVGVWAAQIAKEQNATLHYGNLTCDTRKCNDGDVVTANLQQPFREALLCLHNNNGHCCGNKTLTRLSNVWQQAPGNPFKDVQLHNKRM